MMDRETCDHEWEIILNGPAEGTMRICLACLLHQVRDNTDAPWEDEEGECHV